jgi:uncharacterized membrane protein YcaP (DUF421 family)
MDWNMLWQDMVVPGVSLVEKAVRPVIVYAFLLVGLRLAGRRKLAQLNSFDLIVLFILSNTVQNAIIGNDNSVTGGLLGALVLLVLDFVVDRFLYENPKWEERLEGKEVYLIRDGMVDRTEMMRQTITEKELLEVVRRQQGLEGLDEVKDCILEINGAFTIVPKRPTNEERQVAARVARLDQIQAQIEVLLKQQQQMLEKMQ